MDIELKPSPTGTGITPIMPTEPPKEVKDLVFSTDQLPSPSENVGTTITTDKGVELKETPADIKEEVKVVEATKEKAKPSKETITPVPKKEDVKPTTPAKAEDKTEKSEDTTTKSKVFTPVKDKSSSESDTFDFSKYAPHEVVNMKNMSRQSREAYVKLIDENKQLATLKDASFLQHEEAYVLSPEYKELVNSDRLARIEAQCWEQSLLAIKAGNPFKEITGFDKNGNPTFAAERVATDRDEIRIANNLNLCGQAINQTQNKLQSIPARFKEQTQRDLISIENTRAEKFAWVQDPKLLDHPVDTDNGPQKVIEIKNNFKSLFPTYLRSNPGVEVASDLMVALMIQSAELKEARNGKQISDIKKEEAVRGEPTSEESERVTVKSKKGVPNVFTLDGMPE